MPDLPTEHLVTTITEDNEAICWGCGLRLLLPPNSPVFKCGWCGAITDDCKPIFHKKWFWWRRMRDRCFVCVLVGFMLFVICGGVWAVYPVVFSISYLCGTFHLIVTAILSITTVSLFSLAAFRSAGRPPTIQWGSYPAVDKGHLENYTFCHYCSKPKSPRAHHCRSCGMCVLDMDHHCPFIGNCVGAANHRHFIGFLISAVSSTFYVSIVSVYTGLHIWPPLTYRSLDSLRGVNSHAAWMTLKEIIFALLNSVVLLSSRGLVLVYLFIASISLEIGLSVLLWQQLHYIYVGETYLSHLSSRGEEKIGNCVGAANHRHFIGFLISAVSSTFYVSIVSVYTGLHIWPPLTYRSLDSLRGVNSHAAWMTLKEIIFALLNSVVLLSSRGLVLVYLFIASISLEIGLSVLLWQQLHYIYVGETYLSHLSSRGEEKVGEKDCNNLLRFFGCPFSVSRFLPIYRSSPKKHAK